MQPWVCLYINGIFSCARRMFASSYKNVRHLITPSTLFISYAFGKVGLGAAFQITLNIFVIITLGTLFLCGHYKSPFGSRMYVTIEYKSALLTVHELALTPFREMDHHRDNSVHFGLSSGLSCLRRNRTDSITVRSHFTPTAPADNVTGQHRPRPRITSFC